MLLIAIAGWSIALIMIVFVQLLSDRYDKKSHQFRISELKLRYAEINISAWKTDYQALEQIARDLVKMNDQLMAEKLNQPQPLNKNILN